MFESSSNAKRAISFWLEWVEWVEVEPMYIYLNLLILM
jgi:hypothetical protein